MHSVLKSMVLASCISQLTAWSHVVHQTLTQRGAKLGNITLEGVVALYVPHIHTIWACKTWVSWSK